MRFGVLILPTQHWRQTAEAFRTAERIGYDIAYVPDRFTHGNPLVAGGWLADGPTVLAAATTITKHVELGTLVSSAAIRDPVGLARFSATMQDISGGRMVLGVGAGTPEDYAAARGIQVDQGDLTDRFHEVVEGIRAVWSGATESQGRHACGRLHAGYSGLHTLALPRGVAAPYLMVSAHSPRGMALAARFADGWVTYGGVDLLRMPPVDFWAALGERVAQFDRACKAEGRDPSTVRKSLLLGYGEVQPTNSVAAYVTAAARASAAGFHEMIAFWCHDVPGSPWVAGVEVHGEALQRLHH